MKYIILLALLITSQCELFRFNELQVNGGSGSINFESGICNGIIYTGDYCLPGLGDKGYIMINYENIENTEIIDTQNTEVVEYLENTETVSSDDVALIIFVTVLILICV